MVTIVDAGHGIDVVLCLLLHSAADGGKSIRLMCEFILHPFHELLRLTEIKQFIWSGCFFHKIKLSTTRECRFDFLM